MPRGEKMKIKYILIALSLLLPVVSTGLLDANASPHSDGLAASFTGIRPYTQTDQEFKVAQQDWNERLRKARDKVRDMESRLDQTELEINRLRNFVFGAEPRAAKTQNQTVTRLDVLGAQMCLLREKAMTAQDEAYALLEEGVAKKFKVESLTPKTPSGEPNVVYYRVRFDELQRDRRDAELRTWVMQSRINDLSRRITLSSGTGDNFFISKLRDELQQAQQGVELARARHTLISRQLDELREQARAAGLPPEVWK
jgi:hypothetical protein